MTDEIWMIDFEGTLTNNTWRTHILKKADVDKDAWKEYFKGLEHDEPIEATKDLAILLQSTGRRVILYTTRMPNKYHLERKWLVAQNMKGFELVQRVNTKLPGPLLLREWVEEIKPTHLIDDREENRFAVLDLVPNIFSPDDLTEELDYEQERKNALCD